eukprot:CAMPEP_0204070906 /NCGR_PEP_ID=MMETSP0360-20130528/159239_1 /ASSEMBLY_ACC=CAM_ASM_000342 /TAXON_ID=268821 /ORGANISM="Scrippsiella Hangoei, Strain SHTV-5" /LENGTH=107 /DNA_ID=CAMNT_0051019151 /DNA_START=122 /DNA_END=442 /DNA_ORIENTATION=-
MAAGSFRLETEMTRSKLPSSDMASSSDCRSTRTCCRKAKAADAPVLHNDVGSVAVDAPQWSPAARWGARDYQLRSQLHEQVSLQTNLVLHQRDFEQRMPWLDTAKVA